MENNTVQIVAYAPQYRQAFRALNEAWILEYFVMEPADYKALGHPQEYIIDKGGEILVALLHNEPVGVCALIKMENDPDYEYELGKLAVDPKAQGRRIGRLLCEAMIEKARGLGSKKLLLVSNTSLTTAINLYYKLGFTRITGRETPYQRGNIQMELVL